MFYIYGNDLNAICPFPIESVWIVIPESERISLSVTAHKLIGITTENSSNGPVLLRVYHVHQSHGFFDSGL